MLLKIVTFNLKRTMLRRNKKNFTYRTGAVQEFFAAQQPDIVGTQELTFHYLSQVEELLPDYQWIGLGRDGGWRGEFTAILFRTDKLRLVDQGTFWLSPFPNSPGSRAWTAMFPRICTWGVFEVLGSGGKLVQVYNTHLDHVSPLARAGGIGLIKKHILANARPEVEGTILMGDFNALPTSRAVRALDGANCKIFSDSSYSVSLQQDPLHCRTFHNFSGKAVGNPIDYIFVSENLSIANAVIDRHIYDNQYPSDHYPIVMEVALGNT